MEINQEYASALSQLEGTLRKEDGARLTLKMKLLAGLEVWNVLPGDRGEDTILKYLGQNFDPRAVHMAYIGAVEAKIDEMSRTAHFLGDVVEDGMGSLRMEAIVEGYGDGTLMSEVEGIYMTFLSGIEADVLPRDQMEDFSVFLKDNYLERYTQSITKIVELRDGLVDDLEKGNYRFSSGE
jgi:hypothetical protein